MADSGSGPQRPLALRSRQGRWLMAVTVLGSGMAFLDGTIVNVALPTIGRELHASTGSLQWVLSGYLLTLASLILLGGSLGDRFGRRRVFVLGAGLFAAASLLCAIAPSIGLLIGARLLQGCGGALLTPGSLAMIEASFRREDRAPAIGAWSGLTGVATAVGPLLGGYLIGAVSWRAAFFINIPICAVLASLALASSTYALIEAPAGGSAVVVVLAGVVAALALGAFVVRERRSAAPMLPLDIFSAQFSAANLVTFVVYVSLGGVFFLLVAFLQVSLGYSPVAAGAASLPVTLLMLALSARSGALAQRIGPRLPLAVGPVIVAAGMLLMAQIGRGASYAGGVLPAVLVFGLGLTLVVSPVTATALASAGERHSGIASGVNNAVARLAGLLAVVLLPVIAGLSGRRFFDAGDMTRGFHVAMLVCAGLATAGGVLAWLTIDNGALAPAQDTGGAPVPAPAPAFSCAVAGPPPAYPSEHPHARAPADG